MGKVDFPDLKSVEELGPDGYLVALYENLGWMRGMELEPTRITINQQRWLEVADQYNKLPGGEGGAGGLFFMNYGPSASETVPYGRIAVEPDAFERDEHTLSPAEKATLDRTLREWFTVEGEGPGSVVHLDVDVSDTADFLLQDAYDAHFGGSEAYMEVLRGRIDEEWEEGVDLAADEAVERSGIAKPGDPLFGAAHDFVVESYDFEPPYNHYLDQEVKVNIILGTKAERNLDFGSIRNICDGLGEPGYLDAEDLDNGLAWLVKQQGHTVSELKGALVNYDKWGFDGAEITHGTFLASVASEMRSFPNVMGAVTVLASLSLSDLGKTLCPQDVLTVPKDATVGIFAPWAGGGSGLDIQLERDLDIPSDMRFDVQIEGAKCSECTVGQVYGLVDAAWKEPASLRFDVERPLDDLLREAREKAAERNMMLARMAPVKKRGEIQLDR